MDRQARKLAVHREEGSEGGSELGSNTDSDSDEKVLVSFVTDSEIKLIMATVYMVWLFMLFMFHIMLLLLLLHSTTALVGP
jgi:hypothetical protein